MGRADSPLKPAADAHLLDTSEMDIEAAFLAAKAIIDDVLAKRTRPEHSAIARSVAGSGDQCPYRAKPACQHSSCAGIAAEERHQGF